MVKLWKPLWGFNKVLFLLQPNRSTAVPACWIWCICACATAALWHFPFFMHPTATLLHTKVKEGSRPVPEQSLCLPGMGMCGAELERLLALRVCTRAFYLGLQLYENGCSKGASVVSLTRVNLPYLVLKWGAWRLRRPNPRTFWPC